MTIDEAIKTLEDILTNVEPGDPPEEHDAIKLGIEALKEVKHARSISFGVVNLKLPGETKD